MTAVTVFSDFGAPENKILHYIHFFPSICHKVIYEESYVSKWKNELKCLTWNLNYLRDSG